MKERLIEEKGIDIEKLLKRPEIFEPIDYQDLEQVFALLKPMNEEKNFKA